MGLISGMTRDEVRRSIQRGHWWARAVGGAWAGEAPLASAARLDKLDDKKTLAEYQAAEKARKDEQKRRDKALREAAEKEAEAHGWRE
jgi:hypothetical protein